MKKNAGVISIIIGFTVGILILGLINIGLVKADADTVETQWDGFKLWDTILNENIEKIVIVGSKSESMEVSTTTSISNDGTIGAGIGKGADAGTLFIFARDIEGKRADKKVKAPKDCNSIFGITGRYTDADKKNEAEKRLKSIDCRGLDTSEVVDMRWMFCGNKALKSLDISTFDTSNVTNMYAMFADCYILTSIDVSSFNTQNVTNMGFMFSACKECENLKFGKGFVTNKVTNMECMFQVLLSMTNIDIGQFNTSNVVSMKAMFNGSNLTSINFGDNFDTSKVTNMSFMFEQMRKIEELDIGFFNTKNVSDMSSMFAFCDNLRKLDISGFILNDETNISDFYKMDSKLESVKCSKDTFIKLNFPDSITRVKTEAEEYLDGVELNLKEGNLILDIYVNLPKDLDKEKAFVCLELPGGNFQKYYLKDLDESSQKRRYEKVCIVFSVPISAQNIDDSILVAIYSDEKTNIGGMAGFSLKEYAEALAENDDNYKEFSEALISYGEYAKSYFNNENSNPKGYRKADYVMIATNEIKSEASINDESYIGTTLLLKDKTVLRHYFSKQIPGSMRSGDSWYIEKAFNPNQFDECIDGYKYTVNDYIKEVLTGDYDESLKNLCCSLYYYGQSVENMVQ